MKQAKLIGRRFGRLTITGEGERGRFPSGGTYRKWLCQCDCGKQVEVHTRSLTSGDTSSCGCFQRERASQANLTHGKSETPTFRIWARMWTRCTNKNQEDWKSYGGRGIKVCARWKSFEAFLEDMGERPGDLTLERKDNDGDYSPDNCCWATRSQQNKNKRRHETRAQQELILANVEDFT